MTTTTSFGEQVLADAEKLKATGLDANQLAGVLCKKDPAGKNYGIGIVLGQEGKPLPTSPTLLSFLEKELRESGSGSYANSDAVKDQIREAVLRWQGVPEAYWPHFQLYLPSDAGTGAVQTAIQAAVLMNEKTQVLAVESLGWPAYRALASSARLRFQEFPSGEAVSGEGLLPLYQAGPLNTTGEVPSTASVQARADVAAKAKTPVILDRAYTGFEYARQLTSDNYASLLRKSFEAQVVPFLNAGVPVALAVSPTKAFVSFALRPCGLLLVFHPDLAQAKTWAPKLSGLIRARGSSFEHPSTRAFVKAMVQARDKMEAEHANALRRTAQAELQWQALAKGSAMETLFSEKYAGLFRNPKVAAEGPRELYGAHLYPVFSEGRCRLNVTGLPADPQESASHVSTFKKYCL